MQKYCKKNKPQAFSDYLGVPDKTEKAGVLFKEVHRYSQMGKQRKIVENFPKKIIKIFLFLLLTKTNKDDTLYLRGPERPEARRYKMTRYYVGSEYETSSLTDAKAEMKRTGKPGMKVKIYANGDWVNCGEIKLNGSNRCRVEGNRTCHSY